MGYQKRPVYVGRKSYIAFSLSLVKRFARIDIEDMG